MKTTLKTPKGSQKIPFLPEDHNVGHFWHPFRGASGFPGYPVVSVITATAGYLLASLQLASRPPPEGWRSPNLAVFNGFIETALNRRGLGENIKPSLVSPTASQFVAEDEWESCGAAVEQ